MVTWFFTREFTKSGEFDETKNDYAGLEMLFLIPIFFIIDIILSLQILLYLGIIK